MAEVNVDNENKIGPLIDRNKQYHHGQSDLSHYTYYFGDDDTPNKYFDFLGPAIQKSPTPHPIRTFDPKVIYLMDCNGGAYQRNVRGGVQWMIAEPSSAAELFYQCIIIEIFKVQVLMEWNHFKGHPSEPQLPNLMQVAVFKEFIESVVSSDRLMKPGSVTQDQYELNDQYHDLRSICCLLSHLEHELPLWVERQVQSTLQQIHHTQHPDNVVDVFNGSIERLSYLATQRFGGTR